jgi:cellulose synthase/poly-beta-1,6-N-acetylglucosamine synthase-like glycosyltransferase
MAVRNGAALLPEKVKHLLALDYPNVKEVIVVSDGSTDGTVEFLNQVSDTRFRAIALSEHSGKAVALNEGLKAATGEIVLFVDIRPRVATGAISELVSNFADLSVGCVAGELVVGIDGHEESAAAVGGLYWQYEQWIRKSEAQFDSPVGVYGGFYAARRELLKPFPPGIILDDMFQPLAIIAQGYRSVLDEAAVVHDVWPKTMEGEFQRKVRTLVGNFQLVQMCPWVITPTNRTLFQLLSHKLLRLIVPYVALLMFVSSLVLATQSQLFAAFAGCEIGLLLLLAVSALFKMNQLSRITATHAALCGLNAAAVMALYKFLFTRGPLWKMWGGGKASSTVAVNSPQHDVVLQ